MKLFVVLACLFAYANAHACMLFPAQRGIIPIEVLTKSGSDACAIVSMPPCGKTEAESPKLSFTAGSNATINLQKNLDHFYSSDPGSWEMFLWSSGASFGKSIGKFEDTSDFKTLDTKVATVTIPSDTPVGGAILQLIYKTNNPNAPAMFYQCADVAVALASGPL